MSGDIATNGEAWPDDPVSANILAAQDAFRRALAALLKANPHQWVAFHGERQVCIARTKASAYDECVKQGLHRGEFVIRKIEQSAALDDAEVIN